MKIRAINTKYGLTISVRDVFKYLHEIGVLTQTQERVQRWKINSFLISKLAYQYKKGLVSMQINIFDFNDIFVSWTEFEHIHNLMPTKYRENKKLSSLFWQLDSPHEIRFNDLFDYKEV
jgi:hypothetical protein